MTDPRQRTGRPARLRAIELAFRYRYTAEMERQLGGGPNWRSFAGIRRKWNASWAAAEVGVLHRGVSAVRNANWAAVGIGVLHRGVSAVRNASWAAVGIGVLCRGMSAVRNASWVEVGWRA